MNATFGERAEVSITTCGGLRRLRSSYEEPRARGDHRNNPVGTRAGGCAHFGPDPIQIQQVESSASEPESGAPTVVRIAYVNDERQAARKIVFALSDIAGGEAQVEDVGTFAKGVTIRHDFQAVHLGENVMARVVRVEFADGSTWDAGPTPASDVAMSRPRSIRCRPSTTRCSEPGGHVR